MQPSMMRQRPLFEPRLLDNQQGETVFSFTLMDEECKTSVHVFNISRGCEIVEIKGAQVILTEKSPGSEAAIDNPMSKNYLVLADPILSKALTYDANFRY